VVRLDGEDAGGRFEVGGRRDERRRPLVGGDPDVLEEERAEQEERLGGERVERLPLLDDAGGDGRPREGALQVDAVLRRNLTWAISSLAISSA
jgi:hypothetical protein